jgi:hypothetical protein
MTVSKVPHIDDGALISIVGHSGEVEYGKVKSAVLCLSGKYYFKDDTVNLVPVSVNGKEKKYRRASPLIIQLSDGSYGLKKDCIITKDGAVQLDDGSWTMKHFTVDIDNKRYLISDPDIVKDSTTGAYILKSNSILLSPKYYQRSDLYVPAKQLGVTVVKTADNEYVQLSHVYNVMDGNGEAGFHWN